jgi:hypothetical protein
VSGGAAQALRPTLGLLVWGVHFGVVYAAHALACERRLAGWHVLGLPFVQAVTAAVTLCALGLLVLLARGPRFVADGGEEEPGFREWLAAAACLAAAIAILFQAMPAFVLPPCWAET